MGVLWMLKFTLHRRLYLSAMVRSLRVGFWRVRQVCFLGLPGYMPKHLFLFTAMSCICTFNVHIQASIRCLPLEHAMDILNIYIPLCLLHAVVHVFICVMHRLYMLLHQRDCLCAKSTLSTFDLWYSWNYSASNIFGDPCEATMHWPCLFQGVLYTLYCALNC